MEISPLVTVLLIALRSSSAINAEIAVMKVTRELNTLEAFDINLTRYLFIPRIVSGMISMVLLSGLFSLVVLAIGLLVSRLIFGTSVDACLDTLLRAADLAGVLVVLIKCATFGFFITLILIRLGLNASQELTSIPVSVLNGMVKVFLVSSFSIKQGQNLPRSQKTGGFLIYGIFARRVQLVPFQERSRSSACPGKSPHLHAKWRWKARHPVSSG